MTKGKGMEKANYSQYSILQKLYITIVNCHGTYNNWISLEIIQIHCHCAIVEVGRAFGTSNYRCVVLPLRGATLSYHQHRTTGILTLLPAGVSSGACLCKGAPIPFGDAKGTMEYTPSGGDEVGPLERMMLNNFLDQQK